MWESNIEGQIAGGTLTETKETGNPRKIERIKRRLGKELIQKESVRKITMQDNERDRVKRGNESECADDEDEDYW